MDIEPARLGAHPIGDRFHGHGVGAENAGDLLLECDVEVARIDDSILDRAVPPIGDDAVDDPPDGGQQQQSGKQDSPCQPARATPAIIDGGVIFRGIPFAPEPDCVVRHWCLCRFRFAAMGRAYLPTEPQKLLQARFSRAGGYRKNTRLISSSTGSKAMDASSAKPKKPGILTPR